MATVFCDFHGIIFADYLENRTTINDYILFVLCQIVDIIGRQNHRATVAFDKEESCSNRIKLLHTSAIAMAKILEWRFKLVTHSPYSPDLASKKNLKN